MSIYSNIKEIAEEHGLSIKDVANKANIGENSIYRWDKSTPSVKSLQKVADALHVDVTDLTNEKDNDETPQYRAIQRKAKNLSVTDQDKLLDLMKIAFGDDDDNE